MPETANYSQMVSVVGPMFSENAKTVANILGVFDIPQISYGAMSDDLSNKLIYKYFFRTVAQSDIFWAAMSAFFHKIGWTYVSIVYSVRMWSPGNSKKFFEKIQSEGICIESRMCIHTHTTDEELDKYIEELVSDDKKPKVVILMTHTFDSRAMLAAKKRNPRGNELTFVGGLTWGKRKSIIQGNLID